MVALNWLERRYELYTPKSLSRERSNSLALSVVSNFQWSLRVGSPRNFARACVFRLPHNLLSPKLETTRSLINLQHPYNSHMQHK